MISNVLTKLFGSRNERLLKDYRKVVTRINALEPAPVDGINFRFWPVERIEGGKRFVGYIRSDYLK